MSEEPRSFPDYIIAIMDGARDRARNRIHRSLDERAIPIAPEHESVVETAVELGLVSMLDELAPYVDWDRVDTVSPPDAQ